MSPYERTTNAHAPGHPPCPEDCWEAVGTGWRYTRPANTACTWDGERKQWTRCNITPIRKEHQQ